ncbi:PPOX class F420-dependent oxidoreductase [Halieaceae bacterium IMCC14734]|uniref:PPOX class F420-dependent oxidoreductase n=1 Tax=Candidatus Litorirhabdus singularis TaxID=2518993 RepID=A0ABT3TK38_9GAMM|nr:PPOX class F420-dependent oxidoreductase [Candidatus Litorirhabdus singularis]MCX2982675.1 PPOX class F420-dependent oxidoreductase [Candidatus Litorirhabdus singularis]
MGRDTLQRAAYLSFATFRKSGAKVATPVWFAQEGDALYIFSAAEAGKVKRLRNSDKSEVAACTVSGKVTGPWLETRAEVLTSSADIDNALSALQQKYGWQMKMTNFLSRLSGKYNQRAYIRATLSN